MWEYRAKWRFIGITLGIDTGTLDAIETDNRRVEGCLIEMITTWLKSVNPMATRSAMKTALQSKHLTNQTGIIIATNFQTNLYPPSELTGIANLVSCIHLYDCASARISSSNTYRIIKNTFIETYNNNISNKYYYD